MDNINTEIDYENIAQNKEVFKIAFTLAKENQIEAFEYLLFHYTKQKNTYIEHFIDIFTLDNVQAIITLCSYFYDDKLDLLIKYIQNPAVLKVIMLIYPQLIVSKIENLDTYITKAMHTDLQRVKQITDPHQAIDYFSHQLNLSAKAIIYAIQMWKECNESVQELIDNLHTVLMIKEYYKVPAIMEAWKELIYYSMKDINLLEAMTTFYNDPFLLDLLAESNRYDIANCVLQKIDVTLDFFINIVNEEYWEVLKAVYDTHPSTFLKYLDMLLPQDRDYILFHSKIGHQKIQHTDIPDVFLWSLKKRMRLASQNSQKLIKAFLDRTQITLDDLIEKEREHMTAASLALYIYKYGSLDEVQRIATIDENTNLLQIIEENKNRL